MKDQRFFDLAIKAIAQQATPAERVELDAVLAGDPARQAEFARLQAQAPRARSKGWGWRLFLVLTPVAAVVFGLLTVLFTKPAGPMVQVAIYDTSGETRGVDTNELALLNHEWKAAPARSFVKAEELQAWEKNWPVRTALAKVVYDRSAGEVRVTGVSKGRRFQKMFPVEKDLAATLRLANEFIQAQVK